jgi:hypothetical protein
MWGSSGLTSVTGNHSSSSSVAAGSNDDDGGSGAVVVSMTTADLITSTTAAAVAAAYAAGITHTHTDNYITNRQKETGGLCRHLVRERVGRVHFQLLLLLF